MSSPATTPIQSFVLTGLSTVVGVLFLTVAGKITDKVGQSLMSDATASVVSEASTSVDLVSGNPVASVKHTKPPKAKGNGKESASIVVSKTKSVQNSALDLGVGLPVHDDFFEWDLAFMDEGNPVAYSHGPKLHSRSAIIVDLDSGEILYEKAADTRRSAASVTKVLASLVLADKGVDLDAEVCTDHRIRTGISGAVTRVKVGACATGWDFMGAALVSSDNGAAFAFPMVADEELFMFTHDMNQMALDLGMSQSEFVDPAGIYDGNISTARDLTRASIVAAFHPVVSIPGSAKQWSAQIGDETKHYVTTNKTAGRVNFLLAKTGFTNTARANFTGVYQDRGRRIAFTILGSWNTSRRTKDLNRIIDWVRQH